MATKFKDLGIQPSTSRFTGKSITINEILNVTILVHEYSINPSKKSDGNCLYLQIEFEGEKRVVFTGSIVLQDQIQKVDKKAFPIETTIIRKDKYFEFT